MPRSSFAASSSMCSPMASCASVTSAFLPIESRSSPCLNVANSWDLIPLCLKSPNHQPTSFCGSLSASILVVVLLASRERWLSWLNCQRSLHGIPHEKNSTSLMPLWLSTARLWTGVSACQKKLPPSHIGPLPSQKTYRRRSQPSPTYRGIANQAPRSALLRAFTIPIVQTAVLLRGLVQPVLSPRRSFGDLSEAWLLPGFRDKTLYDSRHVEVTLLLFALTLVAN